ncbi:MAG: hypothetical protein MZW92_28950 [Comamonadaceae bacterium]|nr:hypothetical protein [Comamonadaceae bacterium]
MKRTNPAKGRGVDPKWVPITWDEALDTVADKMIELRKRQRDAQARLHARPLLADLDRPAVRHAAARSSARPTTSRTARSAPRPRRWARA